MRIIDLQSNDDDDHDIVEHLSTASWVGIGIGIFGALVLLAWLLQPAEYGPENQYRPFAPLDNSLEGFDDGLRRLVTAGKQRGLRPHVRRLKMYSSEKSFAADNPDFYRETPRLQPYVEQFYNMYRPTGLQLEKEALARAGVAGHKPIGSFDASYNPFALPRTASRYESANPAGTY